VRSLNSLASIVGQRGPLVRLHPAAFKTALGDEAVKTLPELAKQIQS